MTTEKRRQQMREASRRYRANNLDKERERDRQKRAKDPDGYNARKREELERRKELDPEGEREKQRQKNLRNKDAQLKWQAENKDKCRKATRESMRRNKDKWRDRTLRREYGITAVDYDVMLDDQGGGCAICCGEETATDHRTGNVRRLAVDHDKVTGVVRGLLCRRCNTGIGLLDHDTERLKKSVKYLEKFN